ncbi:MAG: HNH endonuclease [Acidobacteriota bacterium]
MFFDALGEGRSLRSFHNSLKASRDQFDSHIDSGRTGWRVRGLPKPLPEKDQRIFDRWKERSEAELWEVVKPFVDFSVATVPKEVLNDLKAEQGAETERVQTGTEGKKRGRISRKAERSPSLRSAALKTHGAKCQICGFDYEEAYGAWGKGFIEIHHIELLADAPAEGRKVNPISDLAAVCANCHRMLHRRAKTVLTLEQVRAMIRPDAIKNWAESLKDPNL